jgi:hypothetical protein
MEKDKKLPTQVAKKDVGSLEDYSCDVAIKKLEKYFYIFVVALLVALLIQYGYYMLHNPVFTFSDEVIFCSFINNRSIPICSGGPGRFSPLILQEYWPYMLSNLDLSTRLTLMSIHNFVKLILLILSIWFGMRKLLINRTITALTCLSILAITSSLFWLYFSKQAQESTVITLWGAWFYCFVSASRSNSLFYYALAFVFASFSFYEKETAFLLTVPSTFILLTLNLKKLTTRAKVYHFLLIISIVVFFTLYYLTTGFCDQNYLTMRNSDTPLLDSVKFYSFNFPVVKFSCLIALIRFISCAIDRRIAFGLADLLFCNAFMFIMSYVIMKLMADYYPTPAVVTLLIALAIYLQRFLESTIFNKIKKSLKKVAAFLFCFGAILIVSINYKYYRKGTYVEMKMSIVAREAFLKTMNELCLLHNKGYTFLAYIPKRKDCEHEMTQHYRAWACGIVACFMSSLFKANYSPILVGTEKYHAWSFFYCPSEGIDINNSELKGQYLVFDDPTTLTNTFFNSRSNVVYLKRPDDKNIPIVQSKWVSVKNTGYFDMYFKSPKQGASEMI